MASLYSVLPGLTPTSQEILEAELLAKQILEGKFPDLDLREGTGLRDLVLRPTAYAFALLKKANDYHFTQNTLRGVDENTPTEIVDDLLSNWFLARSTGTYAVISARLYFARQKNVTITTDVSFSPDNKLQYYPEESKVYSGSALSYDSYSNEWYLDINLRADTQGSEYNLAEGSLLYFSTFDPYFLRAEINYLVEESTPAETNTQFIERASTAISTRNLVNIPSIDNRIRQIFNYITRVVTVGSGDPDMVRDIIRVVFDPAKSYATTGMTASGDSVTFHMSTDVYLRGQLVSITDAIPTSFNGDFEVVDIGVGTVTFLIPDNPGVITQLPHLTLAQVPLFIHNGGMADVYCGQRLSSNVIQLTTDANGVGRVEGPVYALTRSEISGGNSDDTIPTTKTATSTSLSVEYSLKYLDAVSAAHGFLLTDTPTVSGVTQGTVISSISCAGLTVTAVAPGHGATVGSKVEVSGVSPAAYNGVFTVTAVSGDQVQYLTPAHIALTGSGPYMHLGNADLPTGASITAVATDTFRLSLPSIWVDSVHAPLFGQVTLTTSTPYTVRNPYTRPSVSATIVVENGIASVQIYNHGYTLGRRITITGSAHPAVNGSWRITAVQDGDHFQFYIPALANVASATTSGDIAYVDHRYDYGFSNRQVLEVNFGSSQANKTASFELRTFRDIPSIQSYLESPSNRVLCGDYLARGFNIHLIDVSVVSYNGPAASTAIIQNTIDTFLGAMSAGATLVLSDLIQALGAAGISNIRTPIGVTYTRYTRDLTPPELGVVTDYLDPLDKTNIFILNSVTSTSETV